MALSRLRLSAHDLKIERGRYCSLPVADRLCKSCGVVEDELHFLDSCVLFNDKRVFFLRKINVKMKSYSSFNCNDANQIYITKPSSCMTLDWAQSELAKYVFDCSNARNA